MGGASAPRPEPSGLKPLPQSCPSRLAAIAAAGVLCAAAVAQTWTAVYDGDVLPNEADPAWAVSTDAGGSVEATDGVLRLTTPQSPRGGAFIALGRNTPDQYLTETGWGGREAWDGSRPSTLEFRLRVVRTFSGCKLACQVQASDGRRYFYLHVGPAGICDGAGNVRRELDTTEFHTYRVTLKDGIPNLTVDGEAFPVTCFSPGYVARNALIMGDVSSATAGETEWDYIRWTNQEATPWQHVEVPAMSIDKGTVWIDPRFAEMTPDIDHPCWGGGTPAKLPDGRIMIVYSGPVGIDHPLGSTRVFCRVTSDRGQTWGPEREVVHHPECHTGGPFALTTEDGTVRVFHMGFYRSVWRDGEPDMEQTRSDLWCIESRDGGGTWGNRQMIFRGYTGATNGAIQTRSGHIVVPFSYVVPEPGRLVSACVVSGDGGRTWTLGQHIDFGGHGDHAGALEPAVVELRDGRVWMLIRTTRGQFWQAFSDDNALTWGQATPTDIGSPSAPCHITRLASGRLALVWNNTMETTKGRDALSLAFSEDDGRTWTEPIVCAKAKQVSYPYVFEPEPGVIWVGVHNVNAGFHNLAIVMLEAREDELLSGE